MKNLAEQIGRALELQKQWTASNSAQMQERGRLYTREIPESLAAGLTRWRGGKTGLRTEGGNGVGRIARIPWSRVFDPSKSPSATTGWYVVLLPRFDGTGIYLSLNQGTTTLRGAEMLARSPRELSERTAWARGVIAESGLDTTGLDQSIDLRDTGPLGRGYQRGNVLSRFWDAAALPEERYMQRDLEWLLDLLQLLYDKQDLVEGTQTSSFLLAWNPKNFEWSDLPRLAESVAKGESQQSSWSTRSAQIAAGDRVFMMRLGEEPKGIMASGVAVSGAYKDKHWNGEPGEQTQYVDVRWERILDPMKAAPLGLDVLRRIDPDFTWTPMGSGIRIPDHVAAQIEAEWIALAGGGIALLDETTIDQEAVLVEAYTSEMMLSDVFIDKSLALDALTLLRRRLNLVLQGPPGTGKTFFAKRLAYALMGQKDDSRIEWIQFHQSYSYEEFIEGFRPSPGGGFELRPGVFRRFCETAESRHPLPHVLVIDEINRGNLSRIFGEALSLIEEDKRGQLFARLANSPGARPFSVPPNLYIIGLMNTADRSLAVVDYALRRRFRFINLDPAFESSRFESLLSTKGVPSEVISKLQTRVQALNKAIRDDTRNLGRGFELGHSFFCPKEPVSDAQAWYHQVVTYEIAPLLREYWYESPKRADEWTQRLLGEHTDS